MNSSSHLLVAVIAFLLGCGAVAVLHGDHEELAELTRRNEQVQMEYGRTFRELEDVKAHNRSLVARLEAQRATLSRALVAPTAHAVGQVAASEPTDASGGDPNLELIVESSSAADLGNAIQALADSFEDGDLTRLELMNLAVADPELIRAGINNHALADRFREALIGALSSTDDPIGVLQGVDLRGEPNQRFSSEMAALVRSIADKSAEADPRAFEVIQDLLAGNPMRGEKINLYPALAQLGSRGDAQARALAEQFIRESDSMFSKGIRTLLDPPLYDDLGRDLRGVVIFSSQFNKGDWTHRPKTLHLGDIVLSIGDNLVSSQSDFHNAVSRYQGGDGKTFVPVKLYSPRPDGFYEVQIRQLDPGDFRLMYGAYTLRP